MLHTHQPDGFTMADVTAGPRAQCSPEASRGRTGWAIVAFQPSWVKITSEHRSLHQGPHQSLRGEVLWPSLHAQEALDLGGDQQCK